MKKILLIVLASIMVLGFAASAFAIHAEIPAETQAVVAAGGTQITIGGELRTRGWLRDDLSGGLGQAAEPSAWWDQRVRLSLEAKVTPNITGFVQLETTSSTDGDKYKWGNGENGSTSSTTTPGLDDNGDGVDDSHSHNNNVLKTSDGAANTNTKPDGTLNILQAWIQYTGQGLFGFPAGFKIGHMPLKLSYGQFFDNTQYGDDALVFFMDPIKGLHVGALTFKGNEGSIGEDSDDLDAYVGLVTYKWNDQNTVGANFTYLNMSALDLKMQNLGLHADGSFGNFGYKVAGDIQFGTVGTDDNEVDFAGFAAGAYLNYKLNPVNLRGSVVYGSGDGGGNDDDEIEEFLPFTGNIQNYSFIYEYQHATTAFNPSGLNSAVPTDGHAAGVANTTYVNLGVDWTATKALTLSADGYYFRASDTGAIEDFVGDDVDSNAGWEVDAKLKYAFAKNLIYQIDAGYFKPGSFYSDAYDIDRSGVTSLRHSLTLSF